MRLVTVMPNLATAGKGVVEIESGGKSASDEFASDAGKAIRPAWRVKDEL
jgi:hypothetical protein